MLSYQECPRCSGAIQPENAVVENLVIREAKYLYCEFCGLGIESISDIDGDRRLEMMRCEIDGKNNPVKLGMFLQRMWSASHVSPAQFNKTVNGLRKLQVA